MIPRPNIPGLPATPYMATLVIQENRTEFSNKEAFSLILHKTHRAAGIVNILDISKMQKETEVLNNPEK